MRNAYLQGEATQSDHADSLDGETFLHIWYALA